MRDGDRLADKGAALVEAAICMGFLAVVISGIIEYGGLFSSTIDISAAARDAARTGAATTTEPVDDKDIVAAILGRPNTDPSKIEKVVVYRANASSAGPPQACIDADTSAQPCNIYTTADLAGGPSALVRRSGAQNWPSSSRQDGVDYLGVWVKVRTTDLMQMAWSPDRFSDYAAMRIERRSSVPVAATPSENLDGWPSGTTRDPGFSWENRCFNGTCDGGGVGAPNPPGGGGSA